MIDPETNLYYNQKKICLHVINNIVNDGLSRSTTAKHSAPSAGAGRSHLVREGEGFSYRFVSIKRSASQMKNKPHNFTRVITVNL